MLEVDRPRRKVGLRIVYSDIDSQGSEAWPPEPFGYFGTIGDRSAPGVQPFIITNAYRLHDQRIALPSSGRVTQKGRIRIHRQGTAIGENLPVLRPFLIKNDKETRKLKHLPRCRVRVLMDDAQGQALSARTILRVVPISGIKEVQSPWLIRQRLLEIRGDIHPLCWKNRSSEVVRNGISGSPQSGEVRLTILRSWRRSIEIGPSVREPRYCRSRMVQPLCCDRHGCDCQDRERTRFLIHLGLQSGSPAHQVVTRGLRFGE